MRETCLSFMLFSEFSPEFTDHFLHGIIVSLSAFTFKKQFIETGWVIKDNTACEVQSESDTEHQVTQTEELLEKPDQNTMASE